MSIRCLYLGDVPAVADRWRVAARTAVERLGYNPEFILRDVTFSDAEEVLKTASSLMLNEEVWMQFCVLILDIRYGKHDWDGFDVVYSGLKTAFRLDTNGVATDPTLPRPWRHLIVGTVYASSSDDHESLINKAASHGITLKQNVNLFDFAGGRNEGFVQSLMRAAELCDKRRGIAAKVALYFPSSKALGYPFERPTTLLEAIDMLVFRQHQLEVKGEQSARESGDTKLADEFKIRIQCTEAMQLAVRELINEAGRDATSNALKLDKQAEDDE